MSGPLRFTVIALLSVAAAILFVAPVAAQTLTNAFGGLSENSNEPIDIESDVLVVHDKEKYATFTGNVKAVQGSTVLRANELSVHYVGGDKLNPGPKKKKKKEEGGDVAAAPATKVANAQSGGAAAGGNAQITKIEAKGEVVITSDKDQTTTSDWAIYDLPGQQVTVGGNVVLTQGENVLKGDQLVIDLKTGESRFENSGNAAAGGRIRALFMPNDANKKGKGDAKGRKRGGANGDDSAQSDTPENGPRKKKKPAFGEADELQLPSADPF